jgi:predicted DNA-binding WGR domain protein
MITEMEQSVQKDNEKCNASCNKIKTNYAKDKKKHQLKQKCHHDCWKKRMKTVKAFHKKYPKEFNVFVKSLGGGGSKKETKYICYDGIGSNKTGTHTEKEFLQVMKKNKDNFNENPPKNIKTADQWMKWAGAEKGRCKTKKQPVKLTDKQIRKKCRKSCNKGRKELTKSLKAMDKILKVTNYKELNKKSLEIYDKTCVKTCVDVTKDPSILLAELSFGKSQKGGKKWTVKKSKMKRNANSAYFEFDRFLGKGKFWRITKNGSKITTHYGKIGTLGQMTTKDYGSKVDKKFDSLLKSKKDKGYVEKEYYGHVSESNPKPPTKVEREYLRICKKAEKSKVLNPNAISQDCEAMLDQGESELKWFTGWHKDALKKGEYDWPSYEEHSKSKRKKK